MELKDAPLWKESQQCCHAKHCPPDWAEWDAEHPPLRAKTRLMLHINSYYFIYNPSAEMCTSYVGQGTPPYSLTDGSVESWCCGFQWLATIIT